MRRFWFFRPRLRARHSFRAGLGAMIVLERVSRFPWTSRSVALMSDPDNDYDGLLMVSRSFLTRRWRVRRISEGDFRRRHRLVVPSDFDRGSLAHHGIF